MPSSGRIRTLRGSDGRPFKGFGWYAAWSVLFGTFLVALFWVVALRELDRDWQHQEESIEENLESFARALDGHVGAAVRAIDASLILLRREYRHHRHDINEQAEILGRELLEGGITQIAVIGPDGYLAYTNLPAPPGRTYLGDREHFKFLQASAEDTLFISKPVVGRVSGKATLQFARKMTGPDGSFAGVILLSVDPSYFSRFYDSVKLGKGGVVALAGTDGVLRARSSFQQQALGKDLRNFPAFAPGAPAQGHFHAPSPIDNVPRLYTYRQLEKLPLVVMVGVDEADAFANLVEQRREYLTAAFGGSVVVALSIILLLLQIRRQQALQARYRHVLQHASDGMILCDEQGFIRDVNNEACRTLGYEPAALLGRRYAQIDPAIDVRLLAQLAASGTPLRLEGEHQTKDGRVYAVETTLTSIAGADRLFLGIFRDITQRKEAERHMWRQAHLDGLTGVANRALFRDRLEQAVARARRHSEGLALLFVDLDRFKQVNDTLGHAAGDALLQSVAKRLQGSVRAEDTVARLGGDEFCLILPDLPHRGDATIVAQKILDILDAPHVLGGRALAIAASIGIARFPEDGETADELLRNADGAMYRAKEQGRGGYASSIRSRD
ncbi:MAG TPA: diguanylate cyclase [Aromatoleum sp.]|uniref:sensor domain-containing diguanylate cyclase n=1 Tax=Aromatoleum sp. TaxID=2307007 RepID=UPI002B45F72C|nr:diguanylate cyclase [Aromatoleum sp.]HJV25590.1 diguanylate cyclase [Aromatoleum sp.]